MYSALKTIVKQKQFLVGLLMLATIFGSVPASAQNGEELFSSKGCAACHKVDKKSVGPALGGVQQIWADAGEAEGAVIDWVIDPKALAESGTSPRAAEIYKMMTPQAVTADEAKAILDWADSQLSAGGGGGDTADAGAAAAGGGEADSDSGSANGKLWGLGIAVILFAIFIAYRSYAQTKKTLSDFAYHPGTSTNQFQINFGLMIICALVFMYFLKIGFEEAGPEFNYVMFGAFPYVALALFVVGSIWRYKQKGFQVSSLSSQFMEGKKLFWGSQPFHWGMLVLFFGHLIAFLVPSAIIAWNGSSVRLLILEGASFAFALLALWGLIAFIRRRLTARKLLVVSNNSDMMVYTVLLVQIVSGLCVAYFARWGSNWFASTISPYLMSLFTLNPDVGIMANLGGANIDGMAAHQVWAMFFVKLHVISAFFIIAIIPFTRFMHFLVAPIDYIWRKYQVVIWNWNRKDIRKSTRHTYGHKIKNH